MPSVYAYYITRAFTSYSVALYLYLALEYALCSLLHAVLCLDGLLSEVSAIWGIVRDLRSLCRTLSGLSAV